MSIDYGEVFQVLGSVAAKHPQTSSLIMQTYGLLKDEGDDVRKMMEKFKEADSQSRGPMDTLAVIMQLTAMNPNTTLKLIQVLSMWQSRIPDLITFLQEFRAESIEANKD